MHTIIIHGKRNPGPPVSPRRGREHCDLEGVTRANVEFWHGKLLDWTSWVDVHPLVQTEEFEGIPQRRPAAWQWMCAQDGTRPIYLQAPEEHRPENRAEARRLFALVPGAVAFPIREIQAAFPINGEPNRWFKCQVGMMIAKALWLGCYDRIILNGIGHSSRPEFRLMHEDTLYWLAFARGRGVDVVIEGPSTYHTPKEIYAYDKFNFAELAEQRRYEKLDLSEWDAKEAINARERRRGRPIRFKVPAGMTR